MPAKPTSAFQTMLENPPLATLYGARIRKPTQTTVPGRGDGVHDADASHGLHYMSVAALGGTWPTKCKRKSQVAMSSPLLNIPAQPDIFSNNCWHRLVITTSAQRYHANPQVAPGLFKVSQPAGRVNYTSRFPKSIAGMPRKPVHGWLFIPPSLLNNKVAL